jgi:hypothetical protein
VELLEDRLTPTADLVLQWNEELLNSLSIQPTNRLARNLALVHTAMFDAVNSIDRSYEPYHARVHASRGASQEAAAAQAARDTLVALYPSRQAIYDARLAADLAGIAPGRAQQGVAVGREVARQILALRADDGSTAVVSWTPPNNNPGTYQLTPPNFAAVTGAHIGAVTPFATTGSDQFRPGLYPALDSAEYAADLNEVRVVGASDADQAGVDRDGNGLPDRTAEQTLVAERWRVPLGNHTVWNRIAQGRAAAHDLTLAEAARLFALMNMALHDGLQTTFASKFHYGLWRPVTAIQRAGEDGNPATPAEPTWATEHPTTPPYPAYASNASAIGAACATVLADVFGTNDPFQVNWPVSQGGARSYSNFWAAADEMANSRIYGGIHFRFDCVAGQGVGRDVAGYVMEKFLLPRDNPSRFESGRPDGAAAADFLHVGRVSGSLVVWANGVQLGTFAPSVSGIVVDAGGGDDHILIASQIQTAAELYGGAGDDHIRGGGGDDRIYGEDGDDMLFGGHGNDWLFGGPGLDFVDGGDGDNYLVP